MSSLTSFYSIRLEFRMKIVTPQDGDELNLPDYSDDDKDRLRIVRCVRAGNCHISKASFVFLTDICCL